MNDEENCFEESWIPGVTKMRLKLEKYYDYFQNLLTGIHIVEMPKNCIGNAQHLWGRDTLHFVDEYYQYLYKAIEIITENHSDEEAKLQELRSFYSQQFYNLEKYKRLVYYIAKQKPPENILQNAEFVIDEKGLVSGWKVSCSKKSIYDAKEKMLKCGKENNNWAILSQKIDKERIIGKTITFSIEFMTEGVSVLNFALELNDSINGKTYLFNKQISSYGERKIYSTTIDIPIKVNTLDEFRFLFYTNKPLQQAIVYKVKAEENTISSLF